MTDERQLRKQLRLLEAQVHIFLANMDVIMKTGSDSYRGKKIAEQCNALDFAAQIAARFGLGMHRVNGKLRKVRD